jgi:hypothetical protein
VGWQIGGRRRTGGRGTPTGRRTRDSVGSRWVPGRQRRSGWSGQGAGRSRSGGSMRRGRKRFHCARSRGTSSRGRAYSERLNAPRAIRSCPRNPCDKRESRARVLAEPKLVLKVKTPGTIDVEQLAVATRRQGDHRRGNGPRNKKQENEGFHIVPRARLVTGRAFARIVCLPAEKTPAAVPCSSRMMSMFAMAVRDVWLSALMGAGSPWTCGLGLPLK